MVHVSHNGPGPRPSSPRFFCKTRARRWTVTRAKFQLLGLRTQGKSVHEKEGDRGGKATPLPTLLSEEAWKETIMSPSDRVRQGQDTCPRFSSQRLSLDQRRRACTDRVRAPLSPSIALNERPPRWHSTRAVTRTYKTQWLSFSYSQTILYGNVFLVLLWKHNTRSNNSKRWKILERLGRVWHVSCHILRIERRAVCL